MHTILTLQLFCYQLIAFSLSLSSISFIGSLSYAMSQVDFIALLFLKAMGKNQLLRVRKPSAHEAPRA